MIYPSQESPLVVVSSDTMAAEDVAQLLGAQFALLGQCLDGGEEPIAVAGDDPLGAVHCLRPCDGELRTFHVKAKDLGGRLLVGLLAHNREPASCHGRAGPKCLTGRTS